MRWLFISSTAIWVTGSDTRSVASRARTELTCSKCDYTRIWAIENADETTPSSNGRWYFWLWGIGICFSLYYWEAQLCDLLTYKLVVLQLLHYKYRLLKLKYLFYKKYFCQSRLIFWKTCQDRKNDFTTFLLGCLWIQSIYSVTIAWPWEKWKNNAFTSRHFWTHSLPPLG